MNAFKFLRQMRGYVVPCAQRTRPDLVRGLFSSQGHRRGALIARIPLTACVHANSRYATVAPMFHRLRCHLFGCKGGEERGTSLQVDATASSDDSPGGVVTLSLQPFEATLSFCVALHYFRSMLEVSQGHAVAEAFLPLDGVASRPNSLSRWFFSTIPMRRIDSEGSESAFASTIGDHTSQEIHSCIEQIGHGMFDFFLEEIASDNLRRYLDATGEEDLRWCFVSAVYAVRSRVFDVPVVGRGNLLVPAQSNRSRRLHRRHAIVEPRLQVVAPLLNLMNHAECLQGKAQPSVAVVLSASENAIVVRAVRDIRRMEEFTLDYTALQVVDRHQNPSLHPDISLDEQRDTDHRLAWESRYQLTSEW